MQQSFKEDQLSLKFISGSSELIYIKQEDDYKKKRKKRKGKKNIKK